MDIAEYAEKIMNVELPEWQKEHLRTLDKLRSDGNIHVVMRSRKQVYIYLDQQVQKELAYHG